MAQQEKLKTEEAKEKEESFEDEEKAEAERELPEPTELGEKMEEKKEKINQLERELRDLPEGAEAKRETLSGIQEKMEDISLDRLSSELAVFNYKNNKKLNEQCEEVRENYRSVRDEVKNKLGEIKKAAKRMERRTEKVKDKEEKLKEYETEKENAKQELENKVKKLQEESQGFLGFGGDQEKIEKTKEALSKINQGNLEKVVDFIEGNKEVLEYINAGKLNSSLARKEKAEKKINKIEGKINELSQDVQENSLEAKEALEKAISKYRDFIEEVEELEKEEREARAFVENKVLPELGITEEEEEKYEPGSKIEEEISQEKIEKSFENIREIVETYFQHKASSFRPSEGGIEVEKIYEELQDFLENAKETSRCELNLSEDRLKKIIKDGVYKSLNEMPREEQAKNAKTVGSAASYLNKRERRETKLGTVDKKPVYAALSTDNPYDTEKGPAPKYGDAVVQFEDDVLERARFTMGDSMNASNYTFVEPFRKEYFENKIENRGLIKEHAEISKAMLDHYFSGGDIGSEPYTRDTRKDLHYIEAQVTNSGQEGIPVEEIEKVKFTQGEPSEKMKKKLEKNNIEFEVIR